MGDDASIIYLSPKPKLDCPKLIVNTAPAQRKFSLSNRQLCVFGGTI